MRFKSTTGIYFSLFCFLSVLLVSLACQKKNDASSLKEETALTDAHPIFNKAVGGPVDSATANRWKRNYLTQALSKKTPANTIPASFYLPAAALRALITEEKVAGIGFYFATDSAGEIRLMPVGVHVKGYVITAASVMTSKGVVSWSTAKQWQKDFVQQHPNSICGHFWGTIAVNRLLENNSDTVRIELGMSDNDGAQQMLFSDAAIAAPEKVEDRCRPFLPPNSLAYME